MRHVTLLTILQGFETTVLPGCTAGSITASALGKEGSKKPFNFQEEMKRNETERNETERNETKGNAAEHGVLERCGESIDIVIVAAITARAAAKAAARAAASGSLNAEGKCRLVRRSARLSNQD